MGTFTIRLPDIGEGIAEAELSEWLVSEGDTVLEDDLLGVVMTDKAAVEVPSSVTGKVLWLCGEPGDIIAIGAEYVRLEVDGDVGEVANPSVNKVSEVTPEPSAKATPRIIREPDPTPKPLAPPSVRLRAREAGVDLRQVTGSGPASRISHDDLDAFIAGRTTDKLTGTTMGRGKATGTREIKVIGMRRKIAEKMALSKSRIPHITIVEEVDLTDLETLRGRLNKTHAETRGKLTILPFLMRAMSEAIEEQPQINAHYDDEAGIIIQHNPVHIGIATQTDAGLTVPVVRNTEALSLWSAANELARLTQAARDGKAKPEDMSGSTITVTSLGALGALATTPIINHPEVAIVGVNKIAMRPMWDGAQFVPRQMMNISCSFDHRIIDGYDAAVFVQNLKNLLETPAMLFIED